jgi:hypothetical protein
MTPSPTRRWSAVRGRVPHFGSRPLVAVKNGRTGKLVGRETIADLLSRDGASTEPV